MDDKRKKSAFDKAVDKFYDSLESIEEGLEPEELNDRWWQVYCAAVSGGSSHPEEVADRALRLAYQRYADRGEVIPPKDKDEEPRHQGERPS